MTSEPAFRMLLSFSIDGADLHLDHVDTTIDGKPLPADAKRLKDAALVSRWIRVHDRESAWVPAGIAGLGLTLAALALWPRRSKPVTPTAG